MYRGEALQLLNLNLTKKHAPESGGRRVEKIPYSASFVKEPQLLLEATNGELPMAITIDPRKTFPRQFACRMVTRPEESDVSINGKNSDKSTLAWGIINKDNTGNTKFTLIDDIKFKGEDKILDTIFTHINETNKEKAEERKPILLGYEDPDIRLNPDANGKTFDPEDPSTAPLQLFFTLAVDNKSTQEDSKDEHEIWVFLAQAYGKSLDTLIMGKPVLAPDLKQKLTAKELAAVPNGHHLVESAAEEIVFLYEPPTTSKPNEDNEKLFVLTPSQKQELKTSFSTIRRVIEDTEGNWIYDGQVLNPAEDKNLPNWMKEHVSPGSIIKEYPDGRLLMLVNGRGKTEKDGKFDPFRIGLMIYNPYADKAEEAVSWVSDEPIFSDSRTDAKDIEANVTFASFFELSDDEKIGKIYYHNDDKCIKSVDLDMDGLEAYMEPHLQTLGINQSINRLNPS